MREFYLPALAKSVRYDRGVGFFSSNWMRIAASGLAQLAANGGTARIIASPKLNAEDVAALAKGANAKSSDTLRSALEQSLEDLEQHLEQDTLSAIPWMVVDELLFFRVACRQANSMVTSTISLASSPMPSKTRWRSMDRLTTAPKPSVTMSPSAPSTRGSTGERPAASMRSRHASTSFGENEDSNLRTF